MEKIKYFIGEVVTNSIDAEKRRIRIVISSDKVDRHGDIVEADAVAKAIKDFSKNPVFLACHMHRADDARPTVIGSWDCDSFKQVGGKSEMDAVFATTPLAEDYWQLYSQKHMKAVSIGFRVLDSKTEKKDGNTIYIYTKIELFEISAVAVPANPQALAKMKEMGIAGDNELLIRQAVELALNEVKTEFKENLQSLKKDIESNLCSKLDDIQCLLLDKNSNHDQTAKSFFDGDGDTSDDAESKNVEKSFLDNVLNNIK